METLGSVASVIAAIRDDAAAEVEKLEKQTADIPPEEISIADRDTRIAAAHRENRERIAQHEWESRRATVEQREAWIVRVRGAAHQRWGETSRSGLTALAREALERMPGERCEIAVNANDATSARDGKWLQQLAKATGKKQLTLAPQPAPIAGGCIVTAGGVAFDNSFEQRAHRLEAEWRRALSALYKT